MPYDYEIIYLRGSRVHFEKVSLVDDESFRKLRGVNLSALYGNLEIFVRFLGSELSCSSNFAPDRCL